MSIHDLPAELLTDIFEEVINDDSLIDPFHPTAMSLSRWDKRPTKREWILVSPNEDVHSKQTKTYTATKVCYINTGWQSCVGSYVETLRPSCLPANNGTELPTT